MLDPRKTSEFTLMDIADLVGTDYIIVLDRSATSGPYSGPGGTLKVIKTEDLKRFGS